jgi:glycosyltransferase involved in cell wall biosynthesis
MAERLVLFDLTDFLHGPLRSGIQRVAYEIVAHWPAGSRLVPCRVDERSRLSALPGELLEVYRDFFQASKDELPALRVRLRELSQRRGERITARRFRHFSGLLNASIFPRPSQTRYYQWAAQRGLGERIFLIVFDILPCTHPGYFVPDFGVNLSEYYRCLRLLPNLAYISEQTRTDTHQRLLRDGRPAGPILPLGADSLGTAAPCFDPSRRRFSVIGTLEPRKNHRAVLDAFQQLWRDGHNVELAFAGKLGWLPEAEAQRIRRLKESEPRFTWLDTLSDSQIAETIRGSRATIYPALLEGYGLPPVESLALGVPVIVTASIPAVAMLPPHGQVRLQVPDARHIREAVLAALDDDFARATTEAIRQLRLPTWADLARGVAAWIDNPVAFTVPCARAA